jgi:hypothetical protein
MKRHSTPVRSRTVNATCGHAFRAIAVLIAVALPQISTAEPTRIALDQAPQLVESLLSQNQPLAAREVALAAHQANPADANHLIALARAELALKNFDAAIAAGSQAWQRATSDGQRFVAADTVAAAHFNARNLTRSQFWLRRTRQYAPNQATADRVAQDYATVRAQNPWSTNLRFGASPTSNINNGSTNQEVKLFDLPFLFQLNGEAKALSGVEITAGADVSYRLTVSETAATYATGSVDFRTYSLSKSAQDQAPDALGRDFSDGTVTAGISHRRIVRENALPAAFSLLIGQTYYSEDLHSRFLAGSIAQGFEIDPDNTIDLSLAFRSQTDLTSDTPKSVLDRTADRSLQFGVSWRHGFAWSDILTLGAIINRSTSQNSDSEFRSVTYRANYAIADPVLGMKFAFGVDAETRNFDATRFQSGAREDVALTLSLDVEFADIEFYGFRPVVNAQLKRNRSDVDLFDRDYRSLGFDLRSSF